MSFDTVAVYQAGQRYIWSTIPFKKHPYQCREFPTPTSPWYCPFPCLVTGGSHKLATTHALMR